MFYGADAQNQKYETGSFHLLATEENCNVVEHHRRNVAQLTTQLHENRSSAYWFQILNSWRICVCLKVHEREGWGCERLRIEGRFLVNISSSE